MFLYSYAVPGDDHERPLYASDRIRIKLAPEAIQRAALPTGLYAEATQFGINELDQLYAVNGGQRIIRAHRRVRDTAWESRTGFDRWFIIKLDGKTSVENAISAFSSNRYVEAAEPEYIAYTTAVPNDTYYANNWGHNNTAQLPVYVANSGHTGAGVGTVGYDSDAQLAWNQIQGYGSPSIIIAIIDSGVDLNHPDLLLVPGYDYGDGDDNPMDDSAAPGHGTSCAGIAAARANNGFGVAGIAGGCSVMPLKIADTYGAMYFTYIDNAITHAADNNANVISMSLGAATSSIPSTDTALTYAYNAGVVLFAATGNENSSTVSYPAAHANVIAVGASSPTGQRKSPTSSDGETWWGSNYTTRNQDTAAAVDLMAPTILPTTDITGFGNGYEINSDYGMFFNGTSCATPYAAGVAALVLSKNPSLTPTQVRTALTSNATDMTLDGGTGWDKQTGYGMVNANNALTSVSGGLPACAITSPQANTAAIIGETVTVTAIASDMGGSVSQVQFYIDNVLQNTDSAAPYSWSWNTAGFTVGVHTIKAVATDSNSNTVQSSVLFNLLNTPTEGFETGDFSLLPWSFSGNQPWYVSGSDEYTGSYTAHSGLINHGQNSSLSVSLNITSAGNISFYQMVSSEDPNDFLRFYIDSTLKATWYGAIPWTLRTYAVTTGIHTFKWEYLKNASVTEGSDCARIDHIVFPSYTIPNQYYPPQNLVAVSGNAQVDLSWDAAFGNPTGYSIYRGGAFLTTCQATTYQDNAVINGNTYSYYLISNYSGGNSGQSSIVSASPSNSLPKTAVIGSGTNTTDSAYPCPINVYYKSVHGQSIYTRAELNAAGIVGPATITQLGFDVMSTPLYACSNFLIRMKHTTSANSSSWQTAANLITVYSNSIYSPPWGGYHMLTLSTPFIWNGVENIVVDTAFGLNTSYDASGTVRYTAQNYGYIFLVSDTASQANTFSGGYISVNKANLKLSFTQTLPAPQSVIFADSFESGSSNWLINNAGQTNAWAIGSASKYTGSTGAYISNNSGTSNAYTNSSASVSHLYRDISFPSGTNQFFLRFNWKGLGELNNDYLRVHLVETSVNPVSGTILGSGQIGSLYQGQNTWQEATIGLGAGLNGLNKRLVFTWVNNASGGSNPPIAIDDIRIVSGTQSDAAVVLGTGVNIAPPDVTDPNSNVIDPSIQISNLSGSPAFVIVTSGYASQGAPYSNAGLDFLFEGANYGGATLNITHNLGFIPYQMAYRIGDSGTWNVVDKNGSWTTTTASWIVPASKAATDLRIAFSKSSDGTLPVQLSSFNAVLIPGNKIRLDWITATETGVLGYNIFRHSVEALDSATLVSPLIEGSNTSTEQHYSFTDPDTENGMEYFYWLQGLDIDGWSAFYGSVRIRTGSNEQNPPVIPLETALNGNFPNPFNPVTTIRYALAKPGTVNIMIYNSRGQLLRSLGKTHAAPGFFSLVFDGKDESGNAMASGVYLLEMRSGDQRFSGRMLLSK